MHPFDDAVTETIGRIGPLSAFRQLLQENDVLIKRPDLDNGQAIAAARTAIYTGLVKDWAAEQHRLAGYDRPFAVAAVGGTGRAEMTPFSDTDFALLFDDAIEGNRFLNELQKQCLHTDAFERRAGFALTPLPFSLDDVPGLAGKQLNSFLDLRAVYDPDGLAGRFRERIRATFDPFEQFLHVRGFWKGQWEKAAEQSERLDRFDIKNDGLRVFLAGIWTLASKRFIHSHEVYGTLDDPRDLQAYYFLLRTRAFIHSRKTRPRRPQGGGNHPQDVLGFEDFNSFGEMLDPAADERARFEFANDVRARILSARRRVARFTKGVIGRELKVGREVSPGSPIVYGVGGLYHASPVPGETSRQRTRNALSLLLASQRYGVPIDPAELQVTFRNAGDWLERGPELFALFYEPRGSLADSFEFLSQFEGAEDRLFPGYARYEASLDSRVMAQKTSFRAALEREKMRALEAHLGEGRALLAEAVNPAAPADSGSGLRVPVQVALLDADHLAGVKLALKTKRLPLTPNDLVVRADETLPLHDRFSTGLSDIPLREYYEPYRSECHFPAECVRVAEFLVANRRAFKERSEAGINDVQQVDEFTRLCQDEQLLRSLYVFTHADRTGWENQAEDPSRWFNTRELFSKAMRRFQPGFDPTHSLKAAGYSPDQLEILRDFGDDFFGGVYRQYANRFGEHLARLFQEPGPVGPKAAVLRDGTATLIGVAARDYRGLAASLSGAFWHQKIGLSQAHLFSATNHGLALDFFHVAPQDRPLGSELARLIEDAIERRLYVADSDEANLPRVEGSASLQEWRPGQYRLRFETSEDVGGLIYALTYKVFRYLRGNIFGLTAHVARRHAYVSVYHSLPVDLAPDAARAIVASHF